MPINFPSNPSYGSTYSYPYEGITQTWTYQQINGPNGSTGAWISGSFSIDSGPEHIIGIISGTSEKIQSEAKWKYDVYRADYNNNSSWQISSEQITSGAVNTFEAANTSNLAYGFVVESGEGITLSGFTGFAIFPVPDNTVVEVFQDSNGVYFSAPNPIKGDCE